MVESDNEIDRPKGTEKGDEPSEVSSYWQQEIRAASKTEEDWRKRAEKVIARYRDEKRDGGAGPRMNILWANTQTLAPALYSATPKPDIRRRFRDADPIGKVAADILERAISYSIDQYDFDGVMDGVVLDMLLTGRGVPWVTYEPTFETVLRPAQPGEPGAIPQPDGTLVMEEKQLVYERLICECVFWKDFRVSPSRRWEDVRWIARSLYLTRDELVSRFGGKIGEQVKLDVDTINREDGHVVPDDPFRRAQVWQIWDKTSRKVLHIAPGTPDIGILKEEPDPYNLTGFFPVPNPLYGVRTNDTLTPVTEYLLYEDQALELDRITERIDALVDMIRVRGCYDSSVPELSGILKGADGTLVAVNNWAALQQSGGLPGAVSLLDVVPVANVVAQLYQHRQALVSAIYEITGMSDVIRGASNPNETATAQGIKARYGGLRLSKRQAQVQRLVRDLFRIKAEMIAELFSPDTLLLMTGVQIPTAADKQAAMAQAQQVQQTGQPLPPEVAGVLAQPTLEEVMQVLRSDALRAYRIDIETDSTIAQDLAEDQNALAQLLAGVTQLWQGWGQMVMASQGAVPLEVPKALSGAIVRRAKLGRAVEDALDQIKTPPMPAQGQPDPKAEAEQMKATAQAQAVQMKAAVEAQTAQMDLQAKQAEHAMRMREMERKEQIAAAEFERDMARLRAEAAVRPPVIPVQGGMA